MSVELELTRANRLKLARVFRHHKRVDFSIDCVVEGQMGKAFTDDPQDPAAFQIALGSFWYFAGDAQSQGGREMIGDFPPYALLMPSPSDWIDAAKEIHGSRLVEFDRYSFAPDGVSIERLGQLLARSKFRDAIRRMDVPLATRFLQDPDGFVDLSLFDSADDFVERGVGFCLMDGEAVIGAAYSSLVCSRGIEVSLFVAPEHRQRGAATALASRLLTYCLEQGREPHWDAANLESCKLAEKLGYRRTETYTAYYLEG